MDTPKYLESPERHGRHNSHFPEPVERRGDWSEKPFTITAREAWNEIQSGLPIKGNERNLARGLGWFSIGLGLAEVFAPKSIERFLGINRHKLLLRLIGLREIASGVGILTGRRPAYWLWARVGGDFIDMGSIAVALGSQTAKPVNTGIACATIAAITALDVCCAQEFGRNNGAPLL